MARPSALSDALARIGDRWSLVIVDALMDGPLRFADLQETVEGISTNILAARLRRLETEGVVIAVPYSQRPLRYSYDLTDAGRDLAGAVRMLSQWSADHTGGTREQGMTGGEAGPGGHPTGHDGSRGSPVHPLCGTSMVAVWWCPTCDQVSGSDSADVIWV
jgi:DNA-binding HxlR family transcriptional regulator